MPSTPNFSDINSYPFDRQDIYPRVVSCGKGEYPINYDYLDVFRDLGQAAHIRKTYDESDWFPVFSRTTLPQDINDLKKGMPDIGVYSDHRNVVVGKITSPRILGLLTIHGNLLKVVKRLQIQVDNVPYMSHSRNRHQSPDFYLSNDIDKAVAEEMWKHILLFDYLFEQNSWYALGGGKTCIRKVTEKGIAELRAELKGIAGFMEQKGVDYDSEVHEGDLLLLTNPAHVCESIRSFI